MKTLTIGVSAHNEERSIGQLLQALILQDMTGYQLESIVVMCDGCTDNTVEVIESYAKKSNKIRLLNDDKRVGKISRINWLFANSTTDIIAIFDADIEIFDSQTISKLLSPFSNPSVGLTAGLQLPLPGKTFLQNIFMTWEYIWINIRKNLSNTSTVHNISGCIFAVSRGFYSQTKIPPSVIAEDEFLFFEAKKLQLDFVFVEKSNVFYRLPNAFKEYRSQTIRYIATKGIVSEYYGQKLLPQYSIPGYKKIYSILCSLLNHPLLTFFAVLFHVYVRIYTLFNVPTFSNNTWEVASSTK